MSTRTKVEGLYQIAEGEALRFTVTIASNYPDAVAEAKATVLGCLHDSLADVLAQTRPTTDQVEP
jgi:hypothetical protein